MEDLRLTKAIAEVLTLLESSKTGHEDYSECRILFKECAVLRSLPYNERTNVSITQFCRLMQVRRVGVGDVLLQESNHNPDFLIVLEGLVGNNPRAREGKTWGVLEVLGAAELLGGEMWPPQRVTCLQDAALIQVSCEALEALMHRIHTAVEKTRAVELLTACIPGMRLMGISTKERLASYFQLTHFKLKSCLLPEQACVQCAYLISAGQCLETRRTAATPTHGLASHTMNRLGFGVLGRGEWLGADSILLGLPMGCSVVAVTDVQAYRISREDMLENLGKETIDQLKEIIYRKNSWREARKSLMESTFQVFKQTETVEEPMPLASQAVKHRIRQLIAQRTSSKSKLDCEGSPAAGQVSFSAYQSITHSPEESPVRPTTSSSSLNVSFWFSQFPKRPTCSLRPRSQEQKKRLHMAATLTKTMVPSIPTKRRPLLLKRAHRSTPLGTGAIRDHFGYTTVEQPAASYLERLHRKRAPSPNLALKLQRK